MKTATMPPLRVTEVLRGDAESVLRQGETLSAFLEESLKANITRRKVQNEFIARGMRSREQAKASQGYVSADAVLSGLQDMLDDKKRELRARK